MKKKLKYVIILVAIVLLIILLRSCDFIKNLMPHDMVVIDKNGVVYYETSNVEKEKGRLNKDDVITVTSHNKNGYNIKIKEETGIIKDLNGLINLKKEINPKKENNSQIKEFDKELSALVYSEDGVDIYSGPSKKFAKVGHINKGEKLSYEYGIDVSGITHIYVSYNKQNGWVEVLDSKVLIQGENNYIIINDIETKCGTIKKNTFFKPIYVTDVWSRGLLYQNGDCMDLLKNYNSDDIMWVQKARVSAKRDIDIYENGQKDSKVITTISKNDEFKILGSIDSIEPGKSLSYVQYNDAEGWAFITYSDYDYLETLQ